MMRQTAAPATKSGNEPHKTCKLPFGSDFLLFKFSCKNLVAFVAGDKDKY
jgi:hypothetical protein